MLLAEPPRTPYDWQFSLLRYPVRVTPFFFLVMLLLGYDVSMMLSRLDGRPMAVYLLSWLGVGFVSILLHELGHAAMWRRYGVPSRIVLYHFGGLAVADSGGGYGGGFGGGARPLGSWQRIAVSAAGPGAQLLLAAAVIGACLALGFRPVTGTFLDRYLPQQGTLPQGPALAALMFLQQVNILWALLNLLPVYPLDGGQISRELFLLYDRRDPVRHSLMLSLVAAVALGIWGLTSDQMFLGVMALSLAFSSFQLLQQHNMYGGGFGRGW